MKWRNCNLGANVPEGAGLYYSWGNVNGHPTGGGYNFSQDVYNETIGSQISSNLTLSQDAANVALGGKCRIPNEEDFVELENNCTLSWITINGVNGKLFTSNINGNSIFLPAGGRYNGLILGGRNQGGDYWTSSYFSETNAHAVYFNNASIFVHEKLDRRFGFLIRPVLD